MKKFILFLLFASFCTILSAQEREVEVIHIMEEKYVYLQEINKYDDNTVVLGDSIYFVFSNINEAKSYLSNVTREDIKGRNLSLNKLYIYAKTGREENYTTSIVLAEEKNKK